MVVPSQKIINDEMSCRETKVERNWKTSQKKEEKCLNKSQTRSPSERGDAGRLEI